jgi:hypothetical protein
MPGCSEERRVRDGETGPPAQSGMCATYYSVVSVALLSSASKSAAAPASLIWLPRRLQREKRRVRNTRGETVPPEQSRARDLLERRQRRVALKRLRERRGARVADLVTRQAAARTGGLGRLVGRPLARSRARATYPSVVSVELLLSASENAAAPTSPISLPTSLLR